MNNKLTLIFAIIILPFLLSCEKENTRIPDFLVDKKLKKTFHKLPLVFVVMVFNILRIKGVNRKYIHTKKGVQ